MTVQLPLHTFQNVPATACPVTRGVVVSPVSMALLPSAITVQGVSEGDKNGPIRL